METKTKRKIYSLLTALFFAGSFFLGTGRVKADDCNECVSNYGYEECVSEGFCTGPIQQDNGGWTQDSCKANGGVWENGECFEGGRATDCSQYGSDYVADANGDCVQVDQSGGNELCSTNAECINDFGASYFCDQATKICEERSVDSNVSTANGDICFTDSECAWYAKCKLGNDGATGVCQSYTDTSDPQKNIDNAKDKATNSSSDQKSTGQTIQTKTPLLTSDNKTLPAGTQIDRNTGNAVLPDGTFVKVPMSDIDALLSSSSSGGGLTLCASAITGRQICETTASNGPAVSIIGGNSNNDTGLGNIFGNYTQSGPKCGDSTKFEEIGGVCFPTTTGLANPQGGILQIVSSLFSWLMMLFSILAVLAFVVSGVQYLTAVGDEGQIETAKTNAKWSIVGIIVGLSGFIIVKAIAMALSGQTSLF